MMFMVKNAGLLPEFKTIRSGAIQQHRRDMGDIISGCWRSCVETGDGTQGHEASDNSATDGADHLTVPFVADAIVANPPSLAHIHCAEKLGIPLTIMFTSVFIKAPIGTPERVLSLLYSEQDAMVTHSSIPPSACQHPTI
jgi:hypothetical protein